MEILTLLIRKSLFMPSRRNKEGLLLIVLSLSVGVASIVVVLSIMNEMQDQIIRSLVSIESYDAVLYPTVDIRDSLVQFYNELYTVVDSIDGTIGSALGSAQSDTRNNARGDSLTAVAFSDQAVYVSSPNNSQVMQLRVLDYERANQDTVLLDALNITNFDKGAIVIGALLAQKLQVWYGDVVEVNFVPQSGGFVPQQHNLFIYDVFYSASLYDSGWGFMDIHHYRELFGDYPSSMNIGLRHSRILDNTSIDKLGSMRTWQENNRAFYYALRVEKIMISLLLVVIFFIIVLHYYFVQWRRIFSKHKDIIALRALGYSTRYIRLWFLLETAIVGIVSITCGTLLGFMISRYRATIIDTVGMLFRYRFSIDFGTTFFFSFKELVVLVIGIMCALLWVSFFASRNISRMTSMEFYREFN